MQMRTERAVRSGRADQVVAELFGISRAQAAKAIASGRVQGEGRLISKPSQLVEEDSLLTLEVPEPTEMPLEKQEIPLVILYEDEDIAVVDKPYGMVVHPGAGNENGTLVNALLFALDDLSGIGGVKRPGIVHRLDKDTSGLLMVAKNDEAHLSLSDQLKARTMEKHYLAVVDGEMGEEKGRIDRPIARSKRDRKRMAIAQDGREAVTEWTLLENLRRAALLDVRILTGRTHQIRVHMRSISHPVAGDALYGLKGGIKAPRMMLHAYSLDFDHPKTGQRMHFAASPPPVFTDAVEKLRLNRGEPLPYHKD